METIKATTPEIKDKTNEEIVPPEYHNYLEVFVHKEPTEPPKHRRQDHQIPLEPGTTPPYEPLRPLDERKMKALKEYLDINMK